jgi:hypothetical protein
MAQLDAARHRRRGDGRWLYLGGTAADSDDRSTGSG